MRRAEGAHLVVCAGLLAASAANAAEREMPVDVRCPQLALTPSIVQEALSLELSPDELRGASLVLDCPSATTLRLLVKRLDEERLVQIAVGGLSQWSLLQVLALSTSEALALLPQAVQLDDTQEEVGDRLSAPPSGVEPVMLEEEAGSVHPPEPAARQASVHDVRSAVVDYTPGYMPPPARRDAYLFVGGSGRYYVAGEELAGLGFSVGTHWLEVGSAVLVGSTPQEQAIRSFTGFALVNAVGPLNSWIHPIVGLRLGAGLLDVRGGERATTGEASASFVSGGRAHLGDTFVLQFTGDFGVAGGSTHELTSDYRGLFASFAAQLGVRP